MVWAEVIVMAKNDGGSAFPVVNQMGTQSGMSLRDYFAAKAMQGWLASYGDEASHPARYGNGAADDLARDSYAIADAMLAEREKS